MNNHNPENKKEFSEMELNHYVKLDKIDPARLHANQMNIKISIDNQSDRNENSNFNQNFKCQKQIGSLNEVLHNIETNSDMEINEIEQSSKLNGASDHELRVHFHKLESINTTPVKA